MANSADPYQLASSEGSAEQGLIKPIWHHKASSNIQNVSAHESSFDIFKPW